MTKLFPVLLLFAFPLLLSAQMEFYTPDQIHSELSNLAKKDKRARLETIGKSNAGKDIWILKFQSDHSISQPVIVIVGGADGKHPAGSAMTLELAKHLSGISKDSTELLLNGKAVWFVPVLNPDALAALSSAKPTVLRSGNSNHYDNDRDGRTNEDGFEDMNRDGIISQMRIKSPDGQYIPHAEFPDLLVKADVTKGESGVYTLLSEGIDNDHDGKFNEDDPFDGVNIDRNFTFDYKAFGNSSGAYAASESETRAFMDLINENENIYAVFHFGLQNNLSHAEKFDAKSAKERIIKSWLENDANVSAGITEKYKKLTKDLTDAPAMEQQSGSLSNTVYYHAGRYSFVTPGWWVPSAADSTKSSKSRENADVKLYTWLKKEEIQDAILPWTEIQHPDFPHHTVEIGGLVEYYRNNPPLKYIKESADLHFTFFTGFLAGMPQLKIEEPVVDNLGNNIYRITVKVFNTGELPTYSEMGDKVRFVSKLKSNLELSKNQKIISGRQREVHPALKAGGLLELSWIIQGKGKAGLTLDCATTGTAITEIELK